MNVGELSHSSQFTTQMSGVKVTPKEQMLAGTGTLATLEPVAASGDASGGPLGRSEVSAKLAVTFSLLSSQSRPFLQCRSEPARFRALTLDSASINGCSDAIGLSIVL